jgi:N6-adenosine-specific RNA methylase IME4
MLIRHPDSARDNDQGRSMSLYDAACRAVAEVHRIDEVKDIRDKAVALSVYAKQAKDGGLIAHATAIRKRAERRLGELMEDDRRAGKLAKGGGDKKSDHRVVKKPGDAPSLADQGIDKNLADRARKAATMPEAKFEEQVARAVKLAVAATEGDAAVVREARKAQQDAKLKRRIERVREFADKTLALPGNKYGVVLEDYEWDYETWGEAGKDRHASNHYETSSTAHTAAEIVARTKDRFECAADDCALWMWTTTAHAAIAHEVMRLRGFTYKSQISWDKEIPGTGHWFINQHEILLLGIRGNVPAPAPGTQWPSVIRERKREHSRKPEKSYEMIEAYFPNVPKIELNCRGKPRPGWDAWGNEVEEAAE